MLSIVLHGIVSYCMELLCILWYRIVFMSIVWYCMVLYYILRYCMVLHGIALLASARGLYLARHLTTLYIFLYLTESTMCFSQPTSCYSDSLEVLMLLQSVFPSGRRQGPNKVLHIQKGSLEHPFRCLFFSLSDFFICICQCFCASHRKKSQLLTLTGL